MSALILHCFFVHSLWRHDLSNGSISPFASNCEKHDKWFAFSKHLYVFLFYLYHFDAACSF